MTGARPVRESQRHFVDRGIIAKYLHQLGAAFARGGRLYLVGEGILVHAGWRDRTARLELAGEVALADRHAWEAAVRNLQAQAALEGVEVVEEPPGEVIPLPAGHAGRARWAGWCSELQLFYFDPYSVAFRLIARGDEADYHAVLAFLHHGWLTVETMQALLADLLPQFTSEAIQQDPAEFRRKFKGLRQMWQASRRNEPAGRGVHLSRDA
jgi:Tfp pilus assembly protein PilZ